MEEAGRGDNECVAMWLMHFHFKNAAQSEKASQMICRQNKSPAFCKVSKERSSEGKPETSP
jgi:hypothetical protein